MSYTLHTDIKAKSISYGGSRNASDIKYLVYHYTGNNTDKAVSNAKFFANTNTREAGAHYFIDDTTVYQSIDDLKIAWAVGGKKYTDCNTTGGGKMYGVITNANSISIELCSTNGAISAATQQNAIDFGLVIMKKYNISASNVYTHFDVTGKHCIGWDGWWGSNRAKWNAFKSKLSITSNTSTTTSNTSNSTSNTTSNSTSNNAFIVEIAKYVQKYAPQYGVNVCSPIIAQAILESASGTSELGKFALNFFGLKYHSAVSDKPAYIKTGSEQNADGSYTSSVMQWCNFSSTENGVRGYFKFLFSRPGVTRYNNLKGITDPKQYLETIKADGYATSLKYVENLMNVITKYNLTKYDTVATTQEITTTTVKYYRVQLGAYSQKANAEVMVKKLKSVGFDSIIKQVDGLYKVQLGAYSVKSNAEAKAKEVLAKGFSAIVVYN